MSADESNDGDPLSVGFEETVERVREELDRFSEGFDKRMERRKERWEKTTETVEENMKNYSLSDPIEPADVLSLFDSYGFNSRRKRGRGRRDTKNYSERERFYEFLDNDLDMSEFKDYVD